MMKAWRLQLLRAGGFLAALCIATAAHVGAYDEFFRAVQLNLADTVKTLLAKGFDPNAIEPERGETGLMRAVRENAMDAFGVLLRSPDINLEAKARNGDNALMIASYLGNLGAARTLIEKGAQVNRTGWTPLHYAVAGGHDEIVKLLLEHSAYIDAESPNKTTPLMMAARGGHMATVKLLLDEGADPMLKNELGMTARDFAEKFGFKDIADGLESRMKKAQGKRQ